MEPMKMIARIPAIGGEGRIYQMDVAHHVLGDTAQHRTHYIRISAAECYGCPAYVQKGMQVAEGASEHCNILAWQHVL
jgi:hypothetical protein